MAAVGLRTEARHQSQDHARRLRGLVASAFARPRRWTSAGWLLSGQSDGQVDLRADGCATPSAADKSNGTIEIQLVRTTAIRSMPERRTLTPDGKQRCTPNTRSSFEKSAGIPSDTDCEPLLFRKRRKKRSFDFAFFVVRIRAVRACAGAIPRRNKTRLTRSIGSSLPELRTLAARTSKSTFERLNPAVTCEGENPFGWLEVDAAPSWAQALRL